MDLSLIFKELTKWAREVVGKYETIPINELADKYCEAYDNNNEELKNGYFAALVLRFWFKIGKSRNENPTLGLDYSDYYDGLVDAIQQTLKERNWQKNSNLNAQQIINQVFATRFIAQKYYESNLKKNSGKFMMTSLDEPVLNSNEKLTLADTLETGEEDVSYENSSVYSLIQNYIDNNKLVEAVIMDNIAFKDPFKYEKKNVKTEDSKYTAHYVAFWPHRLVQELASLDDEYKEYFLSTYNVSEPALEAVFKAIHKANGQKKYKYLNATINALKADFGV